MSHSKLLQSEILRTRAILCEDRSRAAKEADVRREWQELAIEWHLMSTRTVNLKFVQIEES
jgi:hypothetical protein